MPFIHPEELQGRFKLGEVLYFDCLGSTNDLAMSLLRHGCAHRTLIIADEQTAGRGRQGRKWFTPPGSALAFSLILKFDPLQASSLEAGDVLSRFTALGAVGACQALRERYQLEACIKWPNDVLLGRKKVGGVLVEALWQGEQILGVVLGVGINVHPPSVPGEHEINYPATCVEAELGKPVAREEVLSAILEAVLYWCERVHQPLFLQKWEELLAFRQEWVEVTMFLGKSARNLQVQILGLDEQGRLRVRDLQQQEFVLTDGEIRLHLNK